MAKVFELRPNKSLLDPSFEGYKLSLDSLPVYKHELPLAVEHLKPNDEQCSFEHVKMFGLHNHLIDDPWCDEIAFFISKDLQIFQINVHSLASLNPEFQPVLKLADSEVNERYNSSLSFSGENLAVAVGGGGALSVIDTACRNTQCHLPWQVKFTSEVFGDKKPYTILHSRFNEECNTRGSLSVLVLKVEPIDQVESQIALSTFGCNDKETPFIKCLEWVEFNHQDGQWSFQRLRRLVVPHRLDYASVLNPGKSLCLLACEPLGIVYDSAINVAVPLSEFQPSMQGESKVFYTWTDSPEEVTVWMSFGKRTSKHDLVVDIKRQSLKVVHKNQVCLDGELGHSVSVESSTWTLSDGKLEIILTKTDRSIPWDDLIVNDPRGQKVMDAETANEWHHRLLHLSSEEIPSADPGRPPAFNSEQLEECDDVPMDDTHLLRFDGETNEFSHKALFGGHQLLFVTPSSPGLSPAFCLRHDVDGLVWQPMGDELEQPWSCIHTAVFQALGYIQASKEQRKFTVTPPNTTYAALCDAFAHIYIYRQPNGSSTGVELVHRPTGRKIGNIARQQVLNLDSQDECIGALATNTFLLILTTSSIFAIRVNSD